jgi:hypothetical protein
VSLIPFRKQQKSLKFVAGVNDTAEKLFTGVNDTADKFSGGVFSIIDYYNTFKQH